MPKYNIEYAYNEPIIGELTNFYADDPVNAEELAYADISGMFPEADDVEIIRVTEVID